MDEDRTTSYRIAYSRRADEEIGVIAAWSLSHFPPEISNRYLDGLRARIEELAINPELGPKYLYGTRRLLYEQFWIHYLVQRPEKQILICAAERIVNLIAVFCILSWRIFWMTMMNRIAPTASPTLALTTVEMRVLDLLIPDNTASRRRKATLLLLISRRLPAWAVISHARKILRPATLSCGAECPASPISN